MGVIDGGERTVEARGRARRSCPVRRSGSRGAPDRCCWRRIGEAGRTSHHSGHPGAVQGPGRHRCFGLAPRIGVGRGRADSEGRGQGGPTRSPGAVSACGDEAAPMTRPVRPDPAEQDVPVDPAARGPSAAAIGQARARPVLVHPLVHGVEPVVDGADPLRRRRGVVLPGSGGSARWSAPFWVVRSRVVLSPANGGKPRSTRSRSTATNSCSGTLRCAKSAGSYIGGRSSAERVRCRSLQRDPQAGGRRVLADGGTGARVVRRGGKRPGRDRRGPGPVRRPTTSSRPSRPAPAVRTRRGPWSGRAGHAGARGRRRRVVRSVRRIRGPT